MRVFNKKGMAWLMAVMMGGSLLTGCGKKEVATMSTLLNVDTQIVQNGTLELTSDYIATAEPNESVNVVPMVAGTVEHVFVKVGDTVKKGDVLCEFDDTAAQFSVDSAKNSMASAQAGKDSANGQKEASAVQTDSSIDSLTDAIATYKKSIKEAKKQLKELQNSKSSVSSSVTKAKKAYISAQTKYKTAEALFVNFQSFLTANPDCQTTSGLASAASADTSSIQIQSLSETDDAVDETQNTTEEASGIVIQSDPSENTAVGEENIGIMENPTATTTESVFGVTDNAGGTTGVDSDVSGNVGGVTGVDSDGTGDTGGVTAITGTDGSTGVQGTMEATAMQTAIVKAKTAQALVTSLKKANLTVEYLSEAGLNALKGNVTDTESAYKSAMEGSGQVESGITSLKQSIATLEGQLSSAENNLEAAKKGKKAADDIDTDAVYDAQIAAAQVGVDSAEYQKSLYTVTAPIGGIVESVGVTENEMASQGYPAFVISSKSTMLVTFYVTEEVRDYLKNGDSVTVESNGESLIGSISSIGTAVDQTKGLFKVEAQVYLIGDQKMSTGASVKVSLVTNSVTNTIVIPYDAVYYESNQAYVYCARDGKAARVDVTTGLYNADSIVVEDGLRPGDEVITTWASGLKDGSEINTGSGPGGVPSSASDEADTSASGK